MIYLPVTMVDGYVYAVKRSSLFKPFWKYGTVYGMGWDGMVRYGTVWYGMVWYGMVLHGMVWHGVRHGIAAGYDLLGDLDRDLPVRRVKISLHTQIPTSAIFPSECYPFIKTGIIPLRSCSSLPYRCST